MKGPWAARWLILLGAGCDLSGASKGAPIFDPDEDGALWPEDCDNQDSAASPGAVERPYDGVDNDCDPDTPDDDLDGDGAGLADDCDDADAARAPDAREQCGDGRVNDCAGSPGAAYAACAGLLSLDAADGRLLGVAPSDRAGTDVAIVGDVNGDGLADLLVGATRYGDADLGIAPSVGAAYLVLGPATGTRGLDAAEATLSGETEGDDAGGDVAGAGDMDQDGVPDLLIGARYASDTASKQGAAYLVLGPATGSLALAEADLRLLGERAADHLGSALAAAGDPDGDGWPALLIGASGGDPGGVAAAGVAYLLEGPISGLGDLSGATATLTGEAAGDYAGWSVASLADAAGDGAPGSLVGAPYHTVDSVENAGAAYWVAGPVTGEISLADADAAFWGTATYHYAGRTVASAGDVDGDGREDLLIGACSANLDPTVLGAAYLVLGPPASLPDLSSAAAVVQGASPDDAIGSALSGAGDVDGDGFDDLAIGSLGADALGQEDVGAVYVLLGPLDGVVDLSLAAATLLGEAAGDRAGAAISEPGDVDGDGFDDLLIGGPYWDRAETERSAGAAWLFRGGRY